MQPIDKKFPVSSSDREEHTATKVWHTRRRQRHRVIVIRIGIALVFVSLLSTATAFAWRANSLQAASSWVDESFMILVEGLGLTVNEVLVSGRVEASREDVRSALAVEPGEFILGIDLSAARARLETLGWIASATVSRSLPRAIHVRLMEQRPYALWQHDGELTLIARDGIPITNVRLGRYAHLPLVVGWGAAERAAEILDLLPSEPNLEARIAAMVWVSGRRWNLKFDNGVEVKLPESGVEEAWRRLAQLESAHRILDRDLLIIDLRLPDRLIVRLEPDAAANRGPGEET